VAHPDPIDIGSIRSASGRQAAIHQDAQNCTHPAARSPVRGHARGLLYKNIQRRHTDMQRAEWVKYYIILLLCTAAVLVILYILYSIRRGNIFIYENVFFCAICRYQTPGRIVPEQAPGTVSLEAQHEGNAIQRRSNSVGRHQLVRRSRQQPVRVHRQSGHDVVFAVHMRPTETPFDAHQFARVCKYHLCIYIHTVLSRRSKSYKPAADIISLCVPTYML